MCKGIDVMNLLLLLLLLLLYSALLNNVLSVNSYFGLTTLYHLHELHVRFTEINVKMIQKYYV